MTCPSCNAASLSSLTGTCELCGYSAAGSVALEADDRVVQLARAELAHDFELVDPVGRSARSAVFATVERGTGRQVMLKVMARVGAARDADTTFRAALTQFTTLDHPHIVPVLRFGVTDSLLWFTRENLRATPLADVLRQGTRLDVRQARRLATQACSALDYLHRRGMTHGDLKPSNVLLDANGWTHLCDPAIHATVSPRGRTPVAPIPEARTPAGDQRALAAVLHACLTGRRPSDDHSALLADTSIPSSVGAAIVRALSPEPRDRFPSLTDLMWALESGSGTMATAAPTGPTSSGVLFISDWEPPAATSALPRRLGILVLVAMVLVALGFAVPKVLGILRPPVPFQSAEAPRPAAASTPVPAPETPSEPQSRLPASAPVTTPSAPVPPPAAPAPVAAQAVLSVNSTPWGRLFIDDREVGNTPRRNIPLTAGPHLVRVTRDGFVPFERSLRLSPGDTVRLTDIVLLPRNR